MRRLDDETWMEIAAWAVLVACYLTAGHYFVHAGSETGAILLVTGPLALIYAFSRHTQRVEDRVANTERLRKAQAEADAGVHYSENYYLTLEERLELRREEENPTH